jgi:hypothetical protein
MTPPNELAERLTSWSTPVAPAVKAISSLALMLGAYDLLWYLAGERLSLPLNIPGLLTLFIAIGVLAVLVVGIAGLYTLMGALFTRHLGDGPFADLLNCGYDGSRLIDVRSQLRHFVTRYSLPQLGLGCMILGEWTSFHWWALATCLGVIPGLLGYEALTLKMAKDGIIKSRGKKVGLWAILSFSWTLFHFFTWSSAILFVAILRYRNFLSTYEGLALAVLICTALNTSALLVRYDKDDADAEKPRTCAGFSLAAIFIASLIPTVSAQTAVFILDRLGLTSTVERYIYAPEKGDGALPTPLVERCIASNAQCVSRPVIVLLDAGSTIQVRIANSTSHEVFRLPAEKFSLSWKTALSDSPQQGSSRSDPAANAK